MLCAGGLSQSDCLVGRVDRHLRPPRPGKGHGREPSGLDCHLLGVLLRSLLSSLARFKLLFPAHRQPAWVQRRGKVGHYD